MFTIYLAIGFYLAAAAALAMFAKRKDTDRRILLKYRDLPVQEWPPLDFEDFQMLFACAQRFGYHITAEDVAVYSRKVIGIYSATQHEKLTQLHSRLIEFGFTGENGYI